jgi:hypothetical protein
MLDKFYHPYMKCDICHIFAHMEASDQISEYVLNTTTSYYTLPYSTEHEDMFQKKCLHAWRFRELHKKSRNGSSSSRSWGWPCVPTTLTPSDGSTDAYRTWASCWSMSWHRWVETVVDFVPYDHYRTVYTLA